MKKRIRIIALIMMMAVCMTGCGNSDASKSGGSSTKSVNDVMNEQISQAKKEEEAKEIQETESETDMEATKSSAEKESVIETQNETAYDVDLTSLSSTMVYSEVNNMMMNPDEYLGKMVKMEGQFTIYQATDAEGNPINDHIYFACVIADATSCCAQGIEFVLAGEHKYPEDYPEIGREITVTGTFGTYEEDGYRYCQLTEAELK